MQNLKESKRNRVIVVKSSEEAIMKGSSFWGKRPCSEIWRKKSEKCDR